MLVITNLTTAVFGLAASVLAAIAYSNGYGWSAVAGGGLLGFVAMVRCLRLQFLPSTPIMGRQLPPADCRPVFTNWTPQGLGIWGFVGAFTERAGALPPQNPTPACRPVCFARAGNVELGFRVAGFAQGC